MFKKEIFKLKEHLKNHNLILNISFEFNTARYIQEQDNIFGFKDDCLNIKNKGHEVLMTEDEFISIGKEALEDVKEDIEFRISRIGSKFMYSGRRKELMVFLSNEDKVHEFLSNKYKELQRLLESDISVVNHGYQVGDIIYGLTLSPALNFSGLKNNFISIEKYQVHGFNYHIDQKEGEITTLTPMIFVTINSENNDAYQHGRIFFEKIDDDKYKMETVYDCVKFYKTKEEAETEKQTLKETVKEQLLAL